MITCTGIDCPLKDNCNRFINFKAINTKPLINVPYNPELKDCDELWLFGASREEYKSFLKTHKN